MLFSTLLVNAQIQTGSFSSRYKELDKRETQTMKERYRLDKKQLDAVTKLNNKYYADLNTAINDPVNLSRKNRLKRIKSSREIALSKIFTSKQYIAYRKDMGIQELRAKQNEQKHNAESKKHSVKINRPALH